MLIVVYVYLCVECCSMSVCIELIDTMLIVVLMFAIVVGRAHRPMYVTIGTGVVCLARRMNRRV